MDEVVKEILPGLKMERAEAVNRSMRDLRMLLGNKPTDKSIRELAEKIIQMIEDLAVLGIGKWDLPPGGPVTKEDFDKLKPK